MNIIRDKEEIAYRILAGDNLINLEIVTSISNNKINKQNVYIDICHQSGITSEIKTLSSWMDAMIEEIINLMGQDISREIHQKQQNKTFRKEIDIPWNARFNSFSLNESLQTRTITYSYYKYNEKLRPEDLNKDPHNIIEPDVKHIKQLKISDKLYNILDSLTLFIPSNNNDSNNVDYSIVISNSTYYTHMLLTVHPATEQYEIVNKINIINKTSKSKKQNQCQQSENTDMIVIPASEHRSLIGQSNIIMTNNYQTKELDRRLYRLSWNANSIVVYELTLWTNLWKNTSDIRKKSLHKFKNIQWLYCSSENKYNHVEDEYSSYYYDTATGYQIILDWSLIGWIGKTKNFFLLHERPINDQTKDLWVYYESPSSSSSKTKSIYGYDEKTVETYNNLEDALKDIEDKVNNNKIKSLYLLSKQQTVDEKKETLERHNIKIYY